ncbi:LytR/AlgR family response regulator transcription factor [Cellulomonas soli]|uniref:LytR/AlgR family response regulator transcription factor n=1 Tax=Cellulomonas soli TaxID=931535 RepID=UPI003F8790FD
MIRIGIAEDDAASAQLLVDYLHRYEQEHGEQFAVSVFTDGSEIVARYRPDYDLLLLDVEMPGLDGLSAAEQIRQVDQDVVIVFITNMAQYAIRGYEVDALSYLLKPVPYFAFSQQLKRSVERARRQATDYLTVPVAGGLARVDTSRIVFVESIKHRIVVHATDATYAFSGALKNVEAELEGKNFFRSNNCYLVNLRHVTSVKDSTCLMVGGHELLISRPRKKPFLAALTDYLGGRHG